MKKLLICLILATSYVHADTPDEIKNLTPPEVEGLQWSRWTSKNFVVLSLDHSSTSYFYLHKHLESIKTWSLARWGLLDVDFSVACKIICVEDKEMFKKLFRLEKTKVEVRRDENGKIKETIIFLLADSPPSSSLPAPLFEVCLAEFGQKYNTDFGWWAYRGMSLLNSSETQIRSAILNVREQMTSDNEIYFSESLLTLTKDNWGKLSDQQQQLFDELSMILCLMIRKEFGQEKFQFLLKESVDQPDDALRNCTNFQNYQIFDQAFKRYLKDLSGDILNKKTPIHYLQVKEN